ncbi:PIG-L family deacetylase [Mongoliimonas terrestris]|uniref:PIG-L family deacetylase n=1 Tax=Mongoliimonas terrestris TaxID=1709001 RepID=UPI000AA52586|nr:PIG-L family deacetylase [Mongoliimonas terrestris]
MSLIDALAVPGRSITRSVALVVAHPDDETLILGGLMRRFSGLTVVHLTDGAPPDGADAVKAGFADTDAYRDARTAELAAALDAAGVAADRRVAFGLADQSLIHHAAPTAARLADLLAARAVEAVITHAYEGGHPDHDAAALSVALAAAILAARGGPDLDIVEAPLYREGPDGKVVVRSPVGSDRPALVLRLDADEQAERAAMLACHRSQVRVIAALSPALADNDVAVFRTTRSAPFTVPPNDGRFLYDRWPIALTGEVFLHSAGLALAEASRST